MLLATEVKTLRNALRFPALVRASENRLGLEGFSGGFLRNFAAFQEPSAQTKSFRFERYALRVARLEKGWGCGHRAGHTQRNHSDGPARTAEKLRSPRKRFGPWPNRENFRIENLRIENLRIENLRTEHLGNNRQDREQRVKKHQQSPD